MCDLIIQILSDFFLLVFFFFNLLREVLTVSPNDNGFVRVVFVSVFGSIFLKLFYLLHANVDDSVFPVADIYQWVVTVFCLSVLLCQANSWSLLLLVEWYIFFLVLAFEILCMLCFSNISIAKLCCFKPVGQSYLWNGESGTLIATIIFII